MTNYISLKQLATELNMDRSGLRKYILQHGFTPQNLRTADSRNQLALVLTGEEAETIRELRTRQGFGGSPKPVDNGKGQFYIVQLIPEIAPDRIKLGYANDASARLVAHQTAAPTAKLLKVWPCKRSWESVIIESITRVGCTLIANEVYVCNDLEALFERCAALFALLPQP